MSDETNELEMKEYKKRIKEVIENTIKDFCEDFVKNPYKCYTEHGLHSLFYTNLYNNFEKKSIPQFVNLKNITNAKGQICLIQKEYPTHTNLGKSKRQHWDISVIDPNLKKSENISKPEKEYDHFKLFAAIEFGLNEPVTHLAEDARRLTHSDSNVENKYIVHLNRLGNNSRRDKSESSKQIININKETTLPLSIEHDIFKDFKLKIQNTGEMGNSADSITMDFAFNNKIDGQHIKLQGIKQ